MAHDAQYTDIKSRFEARRHNFSLKSACEGAGLDELPLYWLAALMFAERVPRMLDAVSSARQRGASDLDKANAESWINIGR